MPDEIKQVKVGQVAIFGAHTHEIGRISAIRSKGFYVRRRNSHPKVPGGREYAYSSVFFSFDKIGANGYDGKGSVTL